MSENYHIEDNSPHEPREALSWCGLYIYPTEEYYEVDDALDRLRNWKGKKPCPDCAREIIKQLLKAIE